MQTVKPSILSLALLIMTILVTGIGSLSKAEISVEKPLDIGPEAIRRAVRQVELERRGLYHAPPKGPVTAHVASVRIYKIDTRDRESCQLFAKQLALIQRAHPVEDDPRILCEISSEGPIKTVAVMDQVDSVEFRKVIDTNLFSTDKNVVTDTRNIAVGMGLMMGLLWVMPESVTKWDKEQVRENPGGLLSRWRENVNKGPVIDHDDPWINYLGHPLSGAATYTMARHSGNGPLASFGYSVAMSTFFWEYGVEAFAEVPSIQDLIVTPVIGSLIGEAFIGVERKIHENNDHVFGSKRLGKIALIVLSPADAFSKVVNATIGKSILKNGSTDITLRRYNNIFGQQVNILGFQLRFEFHGLD
ncbi:hypothetical protein BH10BDE1_BH10BDE1_00530 [soil metagenome]